MNEYGLTNFLGMVIAELKLEAEHTHERENHNGDFNQCKRNPCKRVRELVSSWETCKSLPEETNK